MDIFIFVLFMLFANCVDLQENYELSVNKNTTEFDCLLETPIKLSIIPYEDDFGTIRLNISWPYYQNATPTVHIFIKLNSDDLNCPAHNTIQHNYELNKTFIVVPSLLTDNSAEGVQPGCEYFIELQEPNGGACEIDYQVPECVGKICNCDKYKPDVRTMEVLRKAENIYEIHWEAPFDNITHLELTFTEKNGENTIHGNLQSIDKNFASLGVQGVPEGDYILDAIFFNNYTCPTSNSISFTVTNPTTTNRGFIPLIILCILTVLIILFLFRTRIYKFSKKILYSNRYNPVDLEFQTIEQIAGHEIKMMGNPQYIAADEYELSRRDVEFIKFLDNGAFGRVYEGRYKKTVKVAIKMLNRNHGVEELKDFRDEIELYKNIGEHPNIVRLYGCCLSDDEPLMVMEFAGGNLKSYLEKLREKWRNTKNEGRFFPNSDNNSDGAYIVPDPDSPTSLEFPTTPKTAMTTCEDPFADSPNILDTNELQDFARQIAKGMAYLEEIKITHRDLAARNVLINEQKQLKISDFGLARGGVYIKPTLKGQLPVRWMAIESIIDRKFDNKSDVWSFGVVLWEIGTLCAYIPYPDIPNDNKVVYFLSSYLLNGGRLARPEISTDELYDLMKKCWARNPDDRPDFKELVELLDKKNVYAYIDQCSSNPAYFQQNETAGNIQD